MTTYDAKADWSDTNDPNGVWSYREGNNLLPVHLTNWQGFNPAQPAWGEGNNGGNFLPVMFKATSNVGDWLTGDLVVHTTDRYNGDSHGIVNLLFTAPADGSATVSGVVWYASHAIHRAQDYALSLIDATGKHVLETGHVSTTSPAIVESTRAAPIAFSDTLTLHAGDQLELDMYEAGGASIGGGLPDSGFFVGFDLTVNLITGVAIAGTKKADVIDATHTPAGQLLPTDGPDTVDGAKGNDKISVLGGDDSVDGGAGNDTINGNEGKDHLMGGDGNDKIFGGAGDDTLEGGAGNDQLNGGAGFDTLTGGLGVDKFIFTSEDVPTGGNVLGKITDFNPAEDKINLKGIDAIDGGAEDKFKFIGDTAFSHSAGQLHYVVNPGGGVTVEGDTNGDGLPDFSFFVDHVASLAKANSFSSSLKAR